MGTCEGKWRYEHEWKNHAVTACKAGTERVHAVFPITPLPEYDTKGGSILPGFNFFLVHRRENMKCFINISGTMCLFVISHVLVLKRVLKFQ